jgi:hypothetical protein
MKIRRIIFLALLLLPALVWTGLAPVRACEPDADGTPQPCNVTRARPPTRTPVPAPVKVAQPVVAKPRGDGPATARDIADAWESLPGGASVWYRMGSGPNPQHFDLWLDANGKGGINFAVYAPEQMGDWSPATSPKGRGAFNRTAPDHDLRWSGQAPAGGTWYAVVTNGNPDALTYKLGVIRVETGRRNCGDPYNEMIGSNPAVWQLCP